MSGAGEGNTERWEARCSLCFSTARKGASVGRRHGNRTAALFLFESTPSKEEVICKRVKGIEPSSQAWEAHILPLNHTRV